MYIERRRTHQSEVSLINLQSLSGRGSSPHTKRNSVPRTLISRTLSTEVRASALNFLTQCYNPRASIGAGKREF